MINNHIGSGFFITFEGGEGVGKSTQIDLLKETFKKNSINNCLFTREPGATEIPLCQKLRQIVKNDDMTATTEMLIFFADRNEHVKCSILPALNDGKIVVSDRYYDSTRAYQRVNKDFDNVNKIEILINTFIGDCKPDLTLLLDADPRKVLYRSVEKGKFENRDIDFHLYVRKSYLDLASEFPNRIKVINAEQDFYEKHLDIIKCINVNLNFNLSHLSAEEVARIVINE